MTTPRSQAGAAPEPPSQTNYQSKNGRFISPVEDHPEWSAYLADRHVLEPAIAAGAWVERDKHAGQDVLIWRENRRDGSPGATRRRLLGQVSNNGKKQPKVKWQYAEEKSDEPFHFVGSLRDLKSEIASAGGLVRIVEGEVDVWSLQVMGIGNVIGIYGIGAIPADIASILDELGVSGFIYYLDNDKAGEKGAARLGTLLHDSRWKGEGEYRKVEGPGIAHKGDANDILCHHPDLSAARAALDALPAFLPRIEPEPLHKVSAAGGYNQERWVPVKEAVRNRLGVTDYNRKSFSKKHFRCPDPQHEDPGPSANWHKDGFCRCFGCGKTFNAKEMAEWLGIDWRELLRAQPKLLSTTDIDLNAALGTESAPLSFEQAPDSWLAQIHKHYKKTNATLYYLALHMLNACILPEAFTVPQLIEA